MKRITTTCLVLAGIIVGCGGGESDEDQIRNVVENYYKAWDDGDAGRACEAIKSDVFMESFDEGDTPLLDPYIPGTLDQADCENYIEGNPLDSDADLMVITNIRIQDDSAIVDVGETADDESQVELDLVGEDWMMTSEPLLNGAIFGSVMEEAMAGEA